MSTLMPKDVVIHPTAVVDKKAQLDSGCVIGPLSVVGPNVRIGSNTHLHSHVVIDGHTTVGESCEIYPFACLGKQAQDLKYKGEVTRVVIGDHNEIREYVTIHAPTSPDHLTQVGSYCMLQSSCHIAHECTVGSHVIMCGGSYMAGHVTVEDRALIGGMVGIQQFIRIGTMAMIGACSKQTRDLLPFCISDGNPAITRTINRVGMQRSGKGSDVIQEVHRLLNHLQQDQRGLRHSLQAAPVPQSSEAQHLLQFASNCKQAPLLRD